MKKALPIFILFLLMTTPVVNAQTTIGITANATGSSTTTANQTTHIANLQQRADQEIQRRITALTDLVTKLNTLKRVSSATKTTLSTQIQTEITNLTNLKTKIDADTDLTTLRTDVQSIVTDYRVFLLFIPQVRMLAGADATLTVATNIASVEAKLAMRIQEAQTAGQDVTSLQTALLDMQNKIADANTQAQSVITAVTPLTPQGYPGNKTTLMSARDMLKTAYTDLRNAGQDAKTIIQGLKAFTTTTASSSATQ